MNFYKVPTNLVSIETLRTLQGTEGTYLNPILDENDIWIISLEEWDSVEFQSIRAQYPSFDLIDTVPKTYPEFWGIQ